MKITHFNYLFVVVLSCVALSACGEKAKNENQNTNEKTVKVNTVKNTVSTINNATNLMETTPLTIAELKDWLPDKVLNLNIVEANDAPMAANGINGIVANYQGDDKEKIQLTMYDCAGKNGVLLLGQYELYKNMKVDNENDYKIEKSFNKNGMNGIETFHKDRKFSDISFLYNNRFGVNIKGYDLERETFWKAVEELDFNNLSK